VHIAVSGPNKYRYNFNFKKKEPLGVELQQIILLSEIHEHLEQQNKMSEVNVFLRCNDIFVFLEVL